MRSWVLATGDEADSLSVGESVDKNGFETSLSLESDSDSAYVAVVALNDEGDCLGVSAVHKVAGGEASGEEPSCSDLDADFDEAEERDDHGENDDDSSAERPAATAIILGLLSTCLLV